MLSVVCSISPSHLLYQSLRYGSRKLTISNENSNLNTATKNNLAVLGPCEHHSSGLGINLSF